MEHVEKLERIVKGFANKRRLAMLALLERRPDLPLFGIAETLHLNLKTVSEHVRRLSLAGLVTKRSQGNSVRHALTGRGKSILKFLRILDRP
jgi:DNA-binding transcriptional ArsR family regulator